MVRARAVVTVAVARVVTVVAVLVKVVAVAVRAALTVAVVVRVVARLRGGAHAQRRDQGGGNDSLHLHGCSPNVDSLDARTATYRRCVRATGLGKVR